MGLNLLLIMVEYRQALHPTDRRGEKGNRRSLTLISGAKRPPVSRYIRPLQDSTPSSWPTVPQNPEPLHHFRFNPPPARPTEAQLHNLEVSLTQDVPRDIPEIQDGLAATVAIAAESTSGGVVRGLADGLRAEDLEGAILMGSEEAGRGGEGGYRLEDLPCRLAREDAGGLEDGIVEFVPELLQILVGWRIVSVGGGAVGGGINGDGWVGAAGGDSSGEW